MQKHKINKHQCSNMTQQSGVSLVEVLITVLILAVGSLGVAAMQIAGLNYAAGSYARTQATQLAADMGSRLKINRNEALDLQAGGTYGGSPDYVVATLASSFTSTSNCITGACSPAELAGYDKSSWLSEVSRLLPAGQGQIVFTDNTNADGVVERLYEITLRWRRSANTSDPDAAATSDYQTITYRVGI